MLIVETADMLQAPLFTAEALLRAHGTINLLYAHNRIQFLLTMCLSIEWMILASVLVV